jgi:antitoxin PrlF
MSKQSNMTVKGQVTIPKDVRDALGLKPGDAVEFDWNEAGEAVIRKPFRSQADKMAQKIQRVRETAARFRHLFPEGTDAVAYVRDLRGGEDPALQ